jgi:hypothetical protein
MSESIPLHRRLPRLTTWLLVALALIVVIALVSPAQLPVVAYKLALVSLAAVAAYWLDRGLFPYARPHSYLVRDWRCGRCVGTHRIDYPIDDHYFLVFALATIRRAIIVAAVVIAVALGL